GWYTWSRIKSATYSRTAGHIDGSTGVHLNAADQGHETAMLLRSIQARPGQRYVSEVWVKLDDPELASGVKLSLFFRTKEGWAEKSYSTAAVALDGWQKLVLVAPA